MGSTRTKDPDAILDYVLEWGRLWLPLGDTIVASTWTIPDGITKISDSFTPTTTTIWLSGGTVNTSYECVNHIVTADGREEDHTLIVIIVEK